MRLGVAIGENDPWRFFQDIYQDLASRFTVNKFKARRLQIPIFNERINRFLFFHDLKKFLKSHDVVFFEWASGLLVVASQLPKTCKIVTRIHRYEMYQWVSNVKWDSVDKIIFVSKAMQNKFCLQFPEQRHKTVVIPVGISTELYQLKRTKNNSSNIGTLCFLSPRKRVYELILAFYELTKTNNNLHLHIAGSPDPAFADYTEAMERIVIDLNLKEKVTFYGAIAKPWEWYQNIDIFISNSYSEGLQVALMEAMASGCYCLSHYWDGVEELLPRANLYYSDQELLERVVHYLNKPEIGKQKDQEEMRSIACEKVDIQRIKAQIREVIEELAASPM